MNILGISAFYHDSAAALVQDGRIVAAAQEERFTRKKHDEGVPQHAIRYCLKEGGVGPDDIDVVAFYDKPLNKFERLLKTYFSVAPRGLNSFMAAIPTWMKHKLWIPMKLESCLEDSGFRCPETMVFTEHHESHAASAFFPSPFQTAAILTCDGVGEWGTTAIGHGKGNRLDLVQEVRFPHSLGLLYSAFTYFTGFRVNSGEYKLMGLAPYGEPRFVQEIYDHLIDVRDDGSFRLNMDYFGYLDGLRMTNARFASLFGGPPRSPESEITQREMDLARSIQVVTEDVVLRMARHARELTGEENLCMAGGVALNCVANGKLIREGIFRDVWIQPAAGDAGGALGAALMTWHQMQGNPRKADGRGDSMQGSYLGPGYDDDEIGHYLKESGFPAERLSGAQRAARIAELIADEKVVGLCQGRMEFGPRALGNRSIVGDARSARMQAMMNLKIKYRESFRPFAPSYLQERGSDYFDIDRPSPYMLVVADVSGDLRTGADPAAAKDMRERVNQVRSSLPAITHVDHSARLHSVSPDTNEGFYSIIKAFENLTGEGVVINTSFNVRGEPIVCTPEDAYRCFMRTEMDYLVLGEWILDKQAQPEWPEKGEWREEFALD